VDIEGNLQKGELRTKRHVLGGGEHRKKMDSVWNRPQKGFENGR